MTDAAAAPTDTRSPHLRLLTTTTILPYRCILIDTSNLKAGRVDEDGNALPDKATERDMAAFSALVPFLPMSGSEMYEVSVCQNTVDWLADCETKTVFISKQSNSHEPGSH